MTVAIILGGIWLGLSGLLAWALARWFQFQRALDEWEGEDW